MSADKKEKILDLLRNGTRGEAIRYAEGAFELDEEKATRLVDVLDQQNMSRPRFKIDPGSIVGKMFTAIGAIFFVVVLTLYWNDMRAARGTISITGKVTRLEYSGSGSVPVIKYQHLGKEREYMGTVWSTPPAFDIGEEVELLVDSNNPDSVIVNSFLERYFLIALFSVFAIVFGGVGLLVSRLMKR